MFKVIRKDIKTCGVDESMVKNRGKWRKKIQVVDSYFKKKKKKEK